MPLARIDLKRGRSAGDRKLIGEVIYQALLSIGVPVNDRFQIITEHDSNDYIYDPTYLNVARTDSLVIIQITLNEGRTLELKKKLFSAIADGLHQRLSMRREDVFINLVEVKRENWSFGNGRAQYAE